MAISKQLEDEAKRIKADISQFYEEDGDGILDAEEKEHRIARIDHALAGCNGLTDKEKIQNTAETVFGVTCAMERGFNAIRRQMKESVTENRTNFSAVGKKLDDLTQQIVNFDAALKSHISETSAKTSSRALSTQPSYLNKLTPWQQVLRFADKHSGVSFCLIALILILTFISGHSDWVTDLLKTILGK